MNTGQEWETETCLAACYLEVADRLDAGQLQSSLFSHPDVQGPREIQEAYWDEETRAIIRFDVLAASWFGDPHVVELEQRLRHRVGLVHNALENSATR